MIRIGRSSPVGERFDWLGGLSGELIFWLHHCVCFVIPLALLGYVCRNWENYWLADWAPVVIWTVLISNRTVVGLLPSLALLLFVGLPLSFVFRGGQLLAALSPVGAWLVAVAVRAQVGRWFLARLMHSPESWKRVSKAGLLRQG